MMRSTEEISSMVRSQPRVLDDAPAARRWRDGQVFEDYGNFYAEVYGFTNPDICPVGRLGATILRIQHHAGDWSNAPTPDLVVGVMSRGRPVAISADLGARRFRSTMRTGYSILIAPHADASIQVDGDHVCLALALSWKSVVDAAAGDAALPRNGDFGRLHAATMDNRELSRVVKQLWDGRLERNALYADGLVLQALGLVAQEAGRASAAARGGLAPWQQRRVIEHLHVHLADNVTLADLAQLTGLSTFHFARAFKRSTGVPPHAYLRSLRAERARELLERTEISVAEVALEVGYESGQALARAFCRETGTSPRAYRRKQRS